MLRRVPFRWGFHYFMQRFFIFFSSYILIKTKKTEQQITQLRSYTHYHATCTPIFTGYHTLFTHFPMSLYFFRFRDISLMFRIRWHHSTRSLSSSPLPCIQTHKHTFVHNPLIIISDLHFHIILSRVQPSLIAHPPDTMFCFHTRTTYFVPFPLNDLPLLPLNWRGRHFFVGWGQVSWCRSLCWAAVLLCKAVKGLVTAIGGPSH